MVGTTSLVGGARQELHMIGHLVLVKANMMCSSLSCTYVCKLPYDIADSPCSQMDGVAS